MFVPSSLCATENRNCRSPNHSATNVGDVITTTAKVNGKCRISTPRCSIVLPQRFATKFGTNDHGGDPGDLYYFNHSMKLHCVSKKFPPVNLL